MCVLGVGVNMGASGFNVMFAVVLFAVVFIDIGVGDMCGGVGVGSMCVGRDSAHSDCVGCVWV